MPTKEQVIEELVEWHFQVDPEMVKVYHFLAPNEDDPKEPIKFLEVSPDTPASGSVMPFTFGRTEEIPYLATIATITPEEMEQITRGEISLPPGWNWNEKLDLTTLAEPGLTETAINRDAGSRRLPPRWLPVAAAPGPS